jgi:osmotically-inducible protein OsmY
MTIKRLVSSKPPSADAPPDLYDTSQAHGAVGQLSSDEELQQAICARLLRTPGLDGRDIQVAAHAHGEVMLLGTVATLHQRHLALRVARQLAVGRCVHADLRVQPGPSA